MTIIGTSRATRLDLTEGLDFVRYLARKSGFYVVAAILAITLDFFIPRLVPGSPADYLVARLGQGASAGQIRAIYEQFGGKGHVWTDYAHFWGHLFHGELGISISNGDLPVREVLASHILWTVILVGVATIVSFVLGTMFGTYAAWRRGTWVESVLPALTFLQAMPYFFLATLLLLWFGIHLQWFPSVGGYDFFNHQIGWSWGFIRDASYHAILPAMTIIIASLAGWVIGMRNQVLTVRDEDYVLLAEAAGLPRHRVVYYAARNAILPQVSSFALALSFVVGGSLLTEIVFSYPGIGFMLVTAVAAHDYALVQGVFLIITLVVLVANFVADIVYVALDPRAKQEA